jgi:hypothetical protein
VGEAHVVSALRDKRAEISGKIVDLEKELSRYRTALAHVDATLRLFAPDLLPQSIKPRRRTGRNAWFGWGERARLTFQVLRTADRLLTTREITQHLMAVKGIDPTDRHSQDAVQKSILGLLNRAKTKGFIQRIEGGPGKAVSWRIAQ